MPAGKQEHLGCKPLERSVLAVWTACLTAELPPSADGSRRQGKIQKLKLHSALHPGGGRCQMMSTGKEETPQLTGTCQGWGQQGGEQGRPRNPLGETGASTCSPSSQSSWASSPWSGQPQWLVRTKPIDEDSLASENCVWDEAENASR